MGTGPMGKEDKLTGGTSHKERPGETGTAKKLASKQTSPVKAKTAECGGESKSQTKMGC